MQKNVIYINGNLELDQPVLGSPLDSEVASLEEEVKSNRQPDLLYLKALFVSTGTNKNGACFETSELLKAKDTVSLKALDIEHEESDIIGHIYEHYFIHRSGMRVEFSEFENKTAEELDKVDLDIMIKAVAYKSRFPDICDEIKTGKWKVSMECFYRDFDVKLGNTMISRSEAEQLGYLPLVGRNAKIIDGSKELGEYTISRVLRDIIFCGCGIVKEPANPTSEIIETATSNTNTSSLLLKDIPVINLEDIKCYREGGKKFSVPNNMKEDKDKVSEGKPSENVDGAEQEKLETADFGDPGSMAWDDRMAFAIRTMKAVSPGEDYAHNHVAMLDDGGDGITTFTDDHMHVVLGFKVQTKEDHTHDLPPLAVTNTDNTGNNDGNMGMMAADTEVSSATTQYKVLNTGYPPSSQYRRPRSLDTGLCVNFKKRMTTGSALQTQADQIVREHWCTAFDVRCPVIGADAMSPRCLRNQTAHHDKQFRFDMTDPAGVLANIKNPKQIVDLQALVDMLNKTLQLADGNEAAALNPKAALRNRPSPVFPSTHPKVTDNKDHFPLGSRSQSMNALARVKQYSAAPSWWKGTLEELVNAVIRAVKKKYPGMNVQTKA